MPDEFFDHASSLFDAPRLRGNKDFSIPFWLAASLGMHRGRSSSRMWNAETRAEPESSLAPWAGHFIFRTVNPKTFSSICSVWALLCLTGSLVPAIGAPAVLDPELSIRSMMNTGSDSFQLVRNPVDGALYYLKLNGQLYRVNLSATPGASTSTLLYTSGDHQVTAPAGMAFGPDGSIYLMSNVTISNNTYTVSTVTKGIYNPINGTRTWSVLAAARYPGGSRIFNHQMNAIVVSRDAQSIFVNIGARTDHGEVQTDGGTFPGLREIGLTAVLLRLPIASSGLVLPNDRAQLRALGYVYCEGLRNTYDLAYSPNGDLFGTENGPDRDMPEEINWLQAGLHYGFPWRMGTDANPQQFSNYNASQDKLLNPSYTAVKQGTYTNDPSYPSAPTGFADPVINVGPDADRIRDPVTGGVIDASDAGRTLATFTGHRCPLGLSFDSIDAMGSKFQGHGFVASWTPGMAAGAHGDGPFGDPSQDILHLEFTSLGTNYQVRTTRIVTGFRNPVDTAIIGNRLYVLESGGSQGIWEVTFPATPVPLLSGPAWLANGKFQFTLQGEPDTSYILESTSNYLDWRFLTNYNGSDTPILFSEPDSPVPSYLFYRGRPQ